MKGGRNSPLFFFNIKKKRMLKVGITGGIGSGKSTVGRIFASLGVPVYDADAASKRLMNTSAEMREKIIAQFGFESYNGNTINRQFLASEVFNDKEKLAKLNAIVHPATKKDGEDWMNQQSYPYAIKEAAIIFESGSHLRLDKIIGVSSPLELRIKRTMKRNNISREDVLARMGQQMNEEEKMSLCDFIIFNDEQQLVIPQVLALHQKLMQMADGKI